mgnify:FL=1
MIGGIDGGDGIDAFSQAGGRRDLSMVRRFETVLLTDGAFGFGSGMTEGNLTLQGVTLAPGRSGTEEKNAPATAAPSPGHAAAQSTTPPPPPEAADPLPMPLKLTGAALARVKAAGGMISGGENMPFTAMIPGGENEPQTAMISGGQSRPQADMILGGENIAFADGTLLPDAINVPYSDPISDGENGPFASGQNIGTLTINGDLTFDASSFFEVEVDDQGNGDRVVVLGSVSLPDGELCSRRRQ